MKRTEYTQKWLDALRSGEYEQGTEHLYKDGKYCCLGVALEVMNGFPTGYGDLTTKLRTDLDERSALIKMNDQQGKSFPEIADAIEAMIE